MSRTIISWEKASKIAEYAGIDIGFHNRESWGLLTEERKFEILLGREKQGAVSTQYLKRWAEFLEAASKPKVRFQPTVRSSRSKEEMANEAADIAMSACGDVAKEIRRFI